MCSICKVQHLSLSHSSMILCAWLMLRICTDETLMIRCEFIQVTVDWKIEKVELRLKKILDVELNFKIDICLAHLRSDVELKKLQTLCEAYVKSIKWNHNKIHIWSSKSRWCICAASTEHKETSMNDLKMSVTLRICHAYTKKKLSLLKIENNVSDSLLMSMSQADFTCFDAYAKHM